MTDGQTAKSLSVYVLKNMLKIRPTVMDDLDRIMPIYENAKRRMAAGGNPNQWVGGYPSVEVVTADIVSRNSYVVENGKEIVGVFAFIIGEEPSYARIDGQWPDDRPYGTIHRIASLGQVKGIADACLDFCLSRGVAIRIDTHADNAPMLGWIARRGFKYCGIIHVENGTPRRAFQKL